MAAYHQPVSRMDSRNKMFSGYIQVGFSSLCFSLTPILAKWGFASDVSVVTLLYYRFGIAALFLWFLFPFFRRSWARVELKSLMFLALLGIGGYAIPTLFFFHSLKLIPAGIAEIILYANPVFVILFSKFFSREVIGFHKIISVFFIIVGLFFVVRIEEFRLDSLGMLFAFGSSLIYGAYIWTSQKMVQKVKAQSMSTYVISFAALFFLIVHSFSKGFVTEELLVPGKCVILLLLAFVCTSFPILLTLSGLGKIGAVKTSMIATLEPLWVILFDFIFFGVRLTPNQLMGGVIVLGAVVALILFQPKLR
jgi:drug/metabolite transporter (DMT)-like permease